MGVAISKCYTKEDGHLGQLRAKIHLLQEESTKMKRLRDSEARIYEQHAAHFACKEEEWRQERKTQMEEAASLRQRLKEEEERVRSFQGEMAAGKGHKEWRGAAADRLVEQMEEERVQREEAVEKWKQLYLAIKTELDDLIQRTKQGEGFCWAAEHGVAEGLHRELKAKEEMVEALGSRLTRMQKEAIKKEREIDILRQSLKILSSSKRNSARKNLPRSLRSRII